MTTIEERLHLLECLSKELEHRCREIADVALAELRDRDRIDRWHATYNAAYPYYAAATYSRSRLLSDNMNAAHEGARDAADLAHGPLETKAPVYPSRTVDESDEHASQLECDIVVAKHCGGPVGSAQVLFQRSVTRYVNRFAR